MGACSQQSVWTCPSNFNDKYEKKIPANKTTAEFMTRYALLVHVSPNLHSTLLHCLCLGRYDAVVRLQSNFRRTLTKELVLSMNANASICFLLDCPVNELARLFFESWLSWTTGPTFPLRPLMKATPDRFFMCVCHHQLKRQNPDEPQDDDGD